MIFVDTSAWLFLFDERRGGREAKLAKEFYQRNREPLTISDLIIEEIHKWLTHHSFPKQNALKILEKMASQALAKIISVEEVDRITACLLVKKYLDQNLSYTDAITIAIMKRTKMKKIFAFDSHFDLFPSILRVPQRSLF